jgi:hypothetical protein
MDKLTAEICVNQCKAAPFAPIALRAALNDILPGSAADRLHFLKIAEEEIRIYRELNKPSLEVMRDVSAQLKDAAKAAAAFAAAVAALNSGAKDALQLEYFMSSRRASENDDPGDQMAKAEADFKELLAGALSAGRAADLIAGLVDRAPEKRQRFRAKGTPIDSGIVSMTAALTHAYYVIFNERPSAAAEGTFAKALHEIFAAYGVDATMGEKRLQSIINRIAHRTPAPKRGPKKRE